MDNFSYILFLPDKNNKPLDQDLRCKLNRGLNEKVPMKINDWIEDKSNKSDDYRELLLQLDCDFSRFDAEWLVARFSEFNHFEGIGDAWLAYSPIFNFANLKTYNRSVQLNSFSFGSLIGLNLFLDHYNSSWSKDSKSVRITQLAVKFEHHVAKILISFIVAIQGIRKADLDGRTHRLHSLEILYNMIKRIIIQRKSCKKGETPHYDVYLQMIAAPILKKLERRKTKPKEKKRFDTCEKGDILNENTFHYVAVNEEQILTPFMRDVDFGKELESDEEDETSYGQEMKFTTKIKKPAAAPVAGNSKTTKKKPLLNEAYCSSKVMGMSRVLKLEIHGEEAWEAIEQLVGCCRDHATVFFAYIKNDTVKKEYANPAMPSVHFDSFYALKCILSTTFQVPDELATRKETNQVSKTLEIFLKECPEALIRTLNEIYYLIDQGTILKFNRALNVIYDKHKRIVFTSELKKVLPHEMILMKRAILTPSRFIFLPPVPQMKSFLLRNCDPEYAMRVTVRDDNFDQMTFTVCGTKFSRMKFLNDFIGDKLEKGFKLGNRFYQFFGSSTSQLREHGCFFFAKDEEGRDSEYLRASVGDVHAINNVPKFMARLGQSLSQAMNSVKIPREWVEGPVPDITVKIKNSLKEYNFSDGIGKMSQEIAEMIYAKLDLEFDDKPSAVQIRYGGCKGMLVLDPTLTGKKIIFRKSQWKFDSNQDSLEVLKLSKPQRVYLNRPFITILEQMGISTEVFTKLQGMEFRKLIGSLVDSKDASLVLKNAATLRLPYARLHQCGFDFSSEPFFKPMVLNLYKRSLTELKQKARILIPFEESRTMFGVLDETNTLEYGQVFFQYSSIVTDGKISKQSTVFTGEVMVTKNPCMHPGDVRKFQAIDVEGLHHIRDCLVFPAKGPRPHPDEMAGSDLDGDEYCVIWYKDLIFNRENHEAMDYTSDVNIRENNSIKVKDMVEFMCQYMLDDCVGLIASAHLAWADTIGIFDEKCMSIAKKYSVTLDFAKSGTPEELSARERVRVYPDFMGKEEKKSSYLSTKALGHLYRNCKRIELVSEILKDEVETFIDTDLIYPGWEEYKEDAEAALKEYKYLLFTPAKLFKISKEGEILSGAIKKIEKTFLGKNAKENLDLALDCIIPRVFDKMQNRFLNEFSEDKSNVTYLQKILKKKDLTKTDKKTLNDFIHLHFNEYCRDGFVSADELLCKMFKKISAWYYVAYSATDETSALGLPWAMPGLMGLLKANARLHSGNKKISTVLQLKSTNFIERQIAESNLEIDPQTEEEKANLIMKKWIDHSAYIVTLRGFSTVNLYSVVRKRLMIFNKRFPKFTAAEIVIDFLKDISVLCCSTQEPESNQPLSWISKELGFLAVIALSNLTSNGKLWCEPEENDIVANILSREYRETIRLPLDIGNPLDRRTGQKIVQNSKFQNLMLRRETDVRKTLKSYARLQNVTTDFLETRREDEWYIPMTVYGKVWNIELLKDFLVQFNFVNMLCDMVQNFTNPLHNFE